MLPLLAALPYAVQGFAVLAPAVMGLLKKDSTASKAVEMLTTTAKAITGASTDDEALEALKNNPEMLQKYRESVNNHTLKMYEEDTERMGIINNTLRAAYVSNDPYVRRARPTFSYALIFCFVLMFLTVTGVMMRSGPTEGVKVIEAYAKMQWIFAGAFLAIGVYIKKRSDEKMGLAGGIGMLGKIFKGAAGKF